MVNAPEDHQSGLLKLNLDYADEIVEASILPDKEPDYVLGVKVPHHERSALNMAVKHLRTARKYFLRGNYRSFARYLGRALHYIQDNTMQPPLKVPLPLIRLKDYGPHDSFEEEVDRLPVPEEAILRGLREELTPLEVVGIILSMSPGRTPKEAIYKAAYMTALAIKAVIKPKRPPDLESKYKLALTRHFFLLSLPLSLTLIALAFSLMVSSSGGFLVAVLLLIAMYFVHRSDDEFNRVSFEMEWFREE